MKKLFLSIVLIMAILVGTSCNKKNYSSIDEYVFEYDCQYNLPYDIGGSFALTAEGIYFIKNSFLYCIDENYNVFPVCGKADCMHDSNELWNNNCDAKLQLGLYIFYYDKNLYIVENNGENEYCINKYTLQGKYINTIAYLPSSLQQMIQHRGNFYYTYYAEIEDSVGNVSMIPTLEKIQINDDVKEVIYRNENTPEYLGNIYAYGKCVYAIEMQYNKDTMSYDTNTLIYNVEEDTIAVLEDVQETCIYEGRLLFYKNEGERKQLYASRLDGSDVSEYSTKLVNEAGLFCAFDSFIIEDNIIDYNTDNINNGTYTQHFIVYRDGKYAFEFKFDDVDGRDCSTKIVTSFLITDDAIFATVNDGVQCCLVMMNIDEFEEGRIEPQIVFRYS